MKRGIALCIVGALLLSLLGCASWSKSQKGAAIGTTAGAVVGGIIGKQSDHTAEGAILGAAIGGGIEDRACEAGWRRPGRSNPGRKWGYTFQCG